MTELFIKQETLGALSMLILSASIIFSFPRLRLKSTSTRLLLGFFVGLFGLFIIFVFDTLTWKMHPWYPVINSIILFPGLIGLTSLLQFTYHFPQPFAEQQREARIVLGISCIAVFVVFITIILDVLYYPTNAGYQSQLLLIISGLVWVGIIIVRRMIQFSRQGQTRYAKALRAFLWSFLFALIPVIAVFLRTAGYLSLRVQIVIVTWGLLLFLFSFTLNYLNHTAESLTFTAKLVSFSLVTALLALSTIGFLMAPFFEMDYQPDTMLQEYHTMHFRPNQAGSYDIQPVEFTFEAERGELLHFQQDYKTVSLGFLFPFYGQVRENVQIAKDGVLLFLEDVPRHPFFPTQPLLSGTWFPAIAALFLDLEPLPGGGVFYSRQPDRVSVTWYQMANAPHKVMNPAKESYTFQIVLYADGQFTLSYKTLSAKPQYNALSPYQAPYFVGIQPGGRHHNQPEYIRWMQDLPYQGDSPTGILQSYYRDLRSYLHQRFLPLVYLLVEASLFILIGFPLFFRTNLIIPLNRLVEGVKHVNQGDLQANVPVQYHDEIGFLTRSFNDMVQSLHHAERLQTEYHQKLEQQVKERTTGLTRANEKLEQRVKELMTLNRISQTMTSTLDIQAMLEAFAQEFVTLFHVSSIGIALLNPERSVLTIFADYADKPDIPGAVGKTIALEQYSAMRQILETGRPIVVTQAQTNPLTRPAHDILRTRHIEGIMILPLRSRGEIIGTVSIDTDQPGREFTQDEVTFAETLAGQIAGAIEKARLFEKEHQQRQIAQSLREVSEVLNSSLNVETVLTKILEQLQRVVRYDSAGIFLREENDLVLYHGAGGSEVYIGKHLGISREEPVGRAFWQRKVQIIDDVTTDPGWESWTNENYIRSWMGAPMIINAKAIGVVTADNFNLGCYTAEDGQVLQLFANQAAVAIQNAQLYQEIHRKEVFFETLMLINPVATIVADASTKVTLWNPAAEQLFGYRQEDVIGLNIDDLIATADIHKDAFHYSQLVTQGEKLLHVITQRYRKDGTAVDVVMSGLPVYIEEQLTAIVATYYDITELKQTETQLQKANQELHDTVKNLQQTQNQLIESEKMAAVGKLAANIAHEINTPLGAIRASSYNISAALKDCLTRLPKFFQQLSPEQQTTFWTLLQDGLSQKRELSSREERKLRRALRTSLETHHIPRSDDVADSLVDMGIYADISSYLSLLEYPENTQILQAAYNLTIQYHHGKNILTAVERASRVISALKAYTDYAYSGEQMKLINIPRDIEVILPLYQNQLSQGIEVLKQYEQVPDILCYPDELNQLWNNLITNAIQAMQGKGRLEIIVSRKQKAEARSQGAASDEEYIVVQITDSGCGIPEDIRERIFEPFFTTKPAGEGSGLGLDLVKKIVEKHQGSIDLESRPGKTTFSIRLPLHVN